MVAVISKSLMNLGFLLWIITEFVFLHTIYSQLALLFFFGIWGNGINCFKTIPGAYGTYSHNNYIELLFSVGLAGTFSYYLMYLYTMIKGITNYIKSNACGSAVSISIIISCLITDYAQVGYYDRSSLVFITLAMAMIGRTLGNIENINS